MVEYCRSVEEYVKRGKELGLDVSLYSNPNFDISQVNVIFNALKGGYCVEAYAKPNIEQHIMAFIFECNKSGLNWEKYLNRNHDKWQLIELTYAISKNYPYDEMSSCNYPHQTMGFINLRLDDNKSYKEFLEVDPDVLDYYSYAVENNFDFNFVLGKDLTGEEVVYYIENSVVADGKIPVNDGLNEYSSLEEAEDAVEKASDNVRDIKDLEQRYRSKHKNSELEVARMDIFN